MVDASAAPPPIEFVGRASFDRTRRYRYALLRRFPAGSGRVCFCMLNPSTADARVNDPTVRRCVGYALGWGFEELEVVNIFALRSTDPTALTRAADPVGPRNDAAIRRAARRADLVVAAWGAWGSLMGRGDAALALLCREADVHLLGRTRSGQPRHPLYLRADARPVTAG